MNFKLFYGEISGAATPVEFTHEGFVVVVITLSMEMVLLQYYQYVITIVIII